MVVRVSGGHAPPPTFKSIQVGLHRNIAAIEGQRSRVRAVIDQEQYVRPIR